jgi:hypothetical protein
MSDIYLDEFFGMRRPVRLVCYVPTVVYVPPLPLPLPPGLCYSFLYIDYRYDRGHGSCIYYLEPASLPADELASVLTLLNSLIAYEKHKGLDSLGDELALLAIRVYVDDWEDEKARAHYTFKYPILKRERVEKKGTWTQVWLADVFTQEQGRRLTIPFVIPCRRRGVEDDERDEYDEYEEDEEDEERRRKRRKLEEESEKKEETEEERRKRRMVFQ